MLPELERRVEVKLTLLSELLEVVRPVKPTDGAVVPTKPFGADSKALDDAVDKTEEPVRMLDFKSLFSVVGLESKLDFNLESVIFFA